MKALNEKQAQALEFLRAEAKQEIERAAYARSNGRQPYKPVGGMWDDEFDVSEDEVPNVTLQALARRGLIMVRGESKHVTTTEPDYRRGGFKDSIHRYTVVRVLPSLEEAQQELLSAAVAAADVGPWSPEKARLTRATNAVLAARKQEAS